MTTVFRPRDLAERWQVSERQVRNLVRSGRLPSFKVGDKLIRISAEAVEEFEKCNSPYPSPGEETAPSAARPVVPNVVSPLRETLPPVVVPSINRKK